VNQASLPPRS